jgi:hypothetical protein
MRGLGPLVAVIGLGAVVAGLGACGHHECPACFAPGPAIEIRVTAQGAPGPVSGVWVVASRATPGSASQTTACNGESDASVCRVFGEAGTFNLQVGAPGFDSRQLTVTVSGTSGECCYTVGTQRVSVVLVPRA